MNSPDTNDANQGAPAPPTDPAAESSEAEPMPTEPVEVPAPEPKKRGGSGWLAWLILIALIGAGGYFGYPFVKQQLGEVQGQRALLEHVNKDVNALERRVRELGQAQTELGGRLEGNEQTVGKLSGDVRQLAYDVQGGRKGFQLAAIEQLLLAANDQLHLAGDVRAARLALEEADRRLSVMDDPALIPVRQALSSERGVLATLPDADVAGQILELADLMRQAPQWPLRARAPTQYEVPSSADAADESANSAERLWVSVKRAVAGMFTVRRGDGPAPRLLPPGEEDLVAQALTLKLEGARLAILSADAAATREMCTSANQWLDAYYNTADANVAAAQQKLKALAENASEAPARPDISGSLARLRETMEQRSVR